MIRRKVLVTTASQSRQPRIRTRIGTTRPNSGCTHNADSTVLRRQGAVQHLQTYVNLQLRLSCFTGRASSSFDRSARQAPRRRSMDQLIGSISEAPEDASMEVVRELYLSLLASKTRTFIPSAAGTALGCDLR